MKVSEARIAANRRNAQKSTGPKTPEGKSRSRANALKHGLCASVVVAEDVEAIQSRASEWFRALKPQDPYQGWMVDEVALISLRIERAERMERRARDKAALGAELRWEDDRRLEAEAMGRKLARKPGEAVAALRRTPQGCEWLLARWSMLAHSAEAGRLWTPEQARLAFDLLGTPDEFREGRRPGTILDLHGRAIAGADDPSTVARREIAGLRARLELVAGLDQVERHLVESDLADEPNVEIRRIRRYETSLHARLRWCIAQIQRPTPHRAARPDLEPRWVQARQEPKPDPVESIQLKPAPHPPFDLQPDECPEPGAEVDIPAIVDSRRDKRLRKAEARREARRRKLERLRA